MAEKAFIFCKRGKKCLKKKLQSTHASGRGDLGAPMGRKLKIVKPPGGKKTTFQWKKGKNEWGRNSTTARKRKMDRSESQPLQKGVCASSVKSKERTGDLAGTPQEGEANIRIDNEQDWKRIALLTCGGKN